MKGSPSSPAQSAELDNEDLAYYQEHYAGVTRGRLAQRDPGLYQRLYKADLLDTIPTVSDRYGGDALAFCRSQFAGITRGQLRIRDPALYQYLRVHKLLDELPSNRREIPDLVAYYREHYEGFTRGQLCKADSTLYKRMQDRGLLNYVPVAPRGVKPQLVTDVLAEYRQRYEGLTRGQLQIENPGLYQRLRRRGLLEVVPTKRP